jgi:CDP-glucose 4,6-dehydratase
MELAPNLQNCGSKNPILITGHTGFKGTWLTLLLKTLGIPVIGLALKPAPESLYTRISALGLEAEYFQDIRDFSAVSKIIELHNPSVIFHLAAQPLVIESYRTPRETFEINVMGTANLLEAFMKSRNARLFAGITTDKVYKNLETSRRFQEDDSLSGKDPYSASKVGTESALAAWRQISIINHGPRVISLRAGNVIGGGDYANDRIIPDVIKGFQSGEPIRIRNPMSSRPWQHVLDPLRGYLMASEFALSKGGIDAFNFGPDGESLSVKQLINEATSVWEREIPEIRYEESESNLEAGTLQLDSSTSKKILNWKPAWSQERAIRDTFSWWDKVLYKNLSAQDACLQDIEQVTKQETI